MATAQWETRQQKKDRVADWQGFVRSLSWPAGVSAAERTALYRQGRKDAQSKLAVVDDSGRLRSVFCKELTQMARSRIALDWAKCTERTLDIQKEILELEARERHINQSIALKRVECEEALEAVRSLHYDGDDVVSEHLAKRRQELRERPVNERFQAEIQALQDELDVIHSRLTPLAIELMGIKDMAWTEEALVRADYLWKMSVYAYGAASYVRISPKTIDDADLRNQYITTYEARFKAIEDKVSNLTAIPVSTPNPEDATGGNPTGGTPVNGTPYGGEATEGMPVEGTPTDGAPFGGEAAEGANAPDGKSSVKEEPVEGVKVTMADAAPSGFM